MKEHRKLARWQINQPAVFKLEHKAVVFSPADKAAKEFSCQIKDINTRGAKIILNTKLPEDEAFRITLWLSEDNSIDAEVWVARSKVVNGINHYGLFFSKIKDIDKDKIYKFINKHFRNNSEQKPWLRAVEAEKQEGGEDMNDHRIFERFNKEFSARFIGLDGNERQAQTFDVSAKGLGLATVNELETNASLEIWLNVPNSTEPLYTRGQVVWSKLSGAGVGYQSGIELERADLMGISRLLRA
ncbi:MAG: PilZ domain-containing protein [Candidatus Omnitrophota bacterium]|nr:PilZ domain-containing protein [Candidatus Omnitrophota bacterium]